MKEVNYKFFIALLLVFALLGFISAAACDNRDLITSSCTCNGASVSSGYCCYYDPSAGNITWQSSSTCGYTKWSPHYQSVKFGIGVNVLGSGFNATGLAQIGDILDGASETRSPMATVKTVNPNVLYQPYTLVSSTVFNPQGGAFQDYQNQQARAQVYASSHGCNYEDFYYHFNGDTYYLVDGYGFLVPGWDSVNDPNGDGINNYFFHKKVKSTWLPATGSFSYTINDPNFQSVQRVNIINLSDDSASYFSNSQLSSLFSINVAGNTVSIIMTSPTSNTFSVDISYYGQIQSGAPNPNAHATYRNESRVIKFGWGSERWTFNVNSSCFRNFYAQEYYTMFREISGYEWDGSFIDEVSPGGTFSTSISVQSGSGVVDAYNLTSSNFGLRWFDDLSRTFNVINQQNPGKNFIANTGDRGEGSPERDRINAMLANNGLDGIFMEYYGQLGRKIYNQYELMLSNNAQGKESHFNVQGGYSGGVTTAGMYLDLTERVKMTQLAWYYMVRDPSANLVSMVLHGGRTYGMYDRRMQYPAISFNVGAQTGYVPPGKSLASGYAGQANIFIIQSGIDPLGYTYNVFGRDYSNALTIQRYSSSSSSTPDDNSAVTIDLGGTYYLLRENGSVETTPRTTLTIRNAEGAVLVKASPSPPDTIAPSPITTLSATTSTENSISLSWTATGDDGSTGTASSYDLRYSTSLITSANFASATQASGEPAPQVSGTSQSMSVSGLNANTLYYFAIKAGDDAGNYSSISNVVSYSTLASVPCGDFNGDLKVNIIDLALTVFWQGKNNAQGDWVNYDHIDINSDGKIDMADVTLIRGQLGRSC